MSQDGLATVAMNAAVRGWGGEVEAPEHESNDSLSQKCISCYSSAGFTAQVCFQAAPPLLVVVQAVSLSETGYPIRSTHYHCHLVPGAFLGASAESGNSALAPSSLVTGKMCSFTVGVGVGWGSFLPPR